MDDISDDQIRIIGRDWIKPRPRWYKQPIFYILTGIAVLGIVFLLWNTHTDETKQEITDPEPALFEPEINPEIAAADTANQSVQSASISTEIDFIEPGFTEIRDTLINDIPLKLFIPHNAEFSLQIGTVDKKDSSVIFTAQAADIRSDNGDIVGAFVLKGEPITRGKSKSGFCAAINGKITIGVAQSTPLFEEATEHEGYFFRQYPLVSNGKLIENKPKGKSIRRAICDRYGEIFMVESGTKESFHDFAQALVDLGVDQAIYLVGSSGYGWAIDENGNKHEFGIERSDIRFKKNIKPRISYLVWRRK